MSPLCASAFMTAWEALFCGEWRRLEHFRMQSQCVYKRQSRNYVAALQLTDSTGFWMRNYVFGRDH